LSVHAVTIVFAIAVLVHLVVQIWLALRQVRFVRRRRAGIPESFAGIVSERDHARAADYTVARRRLGIVESVCDAIATLALTLGGGIALAGEWAGRVIASPILSGTLQVIAVFAALALVGVPFAAYRTFGLEQRFGFNRTRVATFVSDTLKSWALGLALGVSATACVLWIMARLGPAWWLAGWGAWLAFTLVVLWVWPRLFAPLFNRFSPLEDAALRGRIDALLARCGFRARAVYVMDGSRRSTHGNAYFTGLGREKRIVFFDTLLERLTPPQVEAVLAHELAHFRLRHVPQRLAVGASLSLAGFALLGWLAGEPWFYTALGVPVRSDAAALLLFVVASPAFTWLAAPLLAAWSRRHEYEADAFAARQSDARALADALTALYRDNASTLTPDPVYSAFHDSHPPPVARIKRLLAPPSAAARRP
jgi:STE24 endopeptidase